MFLSVLFNECLSKQSSANLLSSLFGLIHKHRIKKTKYTELTSIHDKIPPDFGLPVIPRCFKTFSEANAEVLEVTFAYQGLRGAGSDQRAFDG